MKKELTIIVIMELIIASIAIISLSPFANANGGPEIFIEPSFYEAEELDEEFNITVNIRNVTSSQRLVFVQFRVQFNDTFLQAIDVFEGPFLKPFNNTEEPPYTYFTYFIEDKISDPRYGPDVLVGIVIWPNATGEWTNFPEGNGTLATITFRTVSQIWQPLSGELTLNDTMLVDDEEAEISHTVVHGNYEIQAWPPLSITYEPSERAVVGEEVIFTAPEYTYLDHDILYRWNFGDETTLNVTEPTARHTYTSPKEYNVTLICETNGFISNVISTPISIVYYTPLDIEIDGGSIYFRDEVAEFNVLIIRFGKTVNATKIEAILYHNDALYANLSGSVQYIDTGLYRIPYNITSDAETGIYTLVVKAANYYMEGASIKSFQISPTLTSWGDSIAQITEINDGIATIMTDLDLIKANLTAINATITNMIVNSKGEILANITSSLGTLTATLDVIDGKIVDVDGAVATISTTLGNVDVKLDDVNDKLGGVQSTATTTLYVTSALSAIAVILAAAILIFLKKK